MPLPSGTPHIPGAGDDLMTTAETAIYLNMSIHTLYTHLQKGEIPGKKIGLRTWRISRQEIDAYVLNKTPFLRVSLQVQDILWDQLVQNTLDKTTRFGDIRQGHKNPDFIITDQPLSTLGVGKFRGKVITLIGDEMHETVKRNMDMPQIFCTLLLLRQLAEEPRILRKLLGLTA